jgi:hypothetical protein
VSSTQPARCPDPAPGARRAATRVVLLALLAALGGCAFLQSLAALSQVRFDFTRVDGIRLAGVEMDRVRGYEDVRAQDLARLGQALVSNRLPLDLTVHLNADNPSDNPTARILALEWTLALADRETVSGVLDREIQIPSGQATNIPIPISLDLLEFFDGGARELVDLVANIAGVEGEPVDIRLTLLPTVDTPLGPVPYDRPLVLEGSR